MTFCALVVKWPCQKRTIRSVTGLSVAIISPSHQRISSKACARQRCRRARRSASEVGRGPGRSSTQVGGLVEATVRVFLRTRSMACARVSGDSASISAGLGAKPVRARR